jgi:SAM-dependent methyltransferase
MNTQAQLIQRQYDEIIASHYDADPQSVVGDSLDLALKQIEAQEAQNGNEVLKALDLGVGTGRFLEKLRAYAGPRVRPFGLDISEKMIDIARTRLPELTAEVDDAANLDGHFPGVAFDLICTHFITGFIPIDVLAPKVSARLETGGLWSVVGGTKEGFPVLQKKANGKLIKLLFGIKSFEVDDYVCNPADEAEVKAALERHGFAVRACETFWPGLSFKNLEEFLDFAYYGGWLTPFVEGLGLHKANKVMRAVLNGLLFPVRDKHSIVIALAQKS